MDARVRQHLAIWTLRGAVVLAVTAISACILWMVMKTWWPLTFIMWLPTPGLVITQAASMPDRDGALSERGDAPVSPLVRSLSRFSTEEVTRAFANAFTAQGPRLEIAEVASVWADGIIPDHRHIRQALTRALMPYVTGQDAVTRRLAVDAYRAITHCELLGWLRARQEADGGWPAALAPVGPGRWRPGRGASTAFVLMLLADCRYDQGTPSKFRKTIVRALAHLRALERPDGRFADDARDHAVITCALVIFHSMSRDGELLDPAQHALTAMRAGMVDGGECAWRQDTALALFQLLAHKCARDARLEVGPVLAAPFRDLRASWTADNPAPAAPPCFPWREHGAVVAGGEADGLGAALYGFGIARSCGAAASERNPPELAILATRIAGSSPDPERWTPLGYDCASLGMTGYYPSLGTPARAWLQAAEQALAADETIGDEAWDGTWGRTDRPRDAVANMILGDALMVLSSTLSDMHFWDAERRRPLH